MKTPRAAGSKPPALKLYLVDDFGLELIAVWALTKASAKALARREHGPREYNSWTRQEKLLPYEAEVYPFPMEGVGAPAAPGLETRREVLEAIEKDPRLKAIVG